MLLAIAVDLALVGLQGRLTPWSRARVDRSLSGLDHVTPEAVAGGPA
jgi:hypothetical protein